jgi:ABC-type glycerol-3-phosphate transport system substrate-binding protein
MNDKRFEVIENQLLNQSKAGQISRRSFLQMATMAGLSLAGINALGVNSVLAQDATEAASTRPLTPTFYQWVVDLHPAIADVNKQFPGMDMEIAPVSGFGVERFIAEAKSGMSTWDVYVGTTPFVELKSLVDTGAIEPWDDYIPKEVVDDLIPSIREECTIDGKLYSWPFFLDVIVQAYNKSITDAAGIADAPPATWEEYLANSKTVLDKNAARYGCTFDAHGWRSIAPITHSISTDVYYKLDGDKDPAPLFDFTNPAVVQALQYMKQMLDLSGANALQPGTTDGGVNNTPDEVAFAAQQVAYYIKYQNAPLRMAGTWTDPSALRMGALPKPGTGTPAGSTVFWTTGAALFKYGQNKEKVAEYMKALTYDLKLWQDSIAGSSASTSASGIVAGHPGQLPPYKSLYDQWNSEKPDWYTSQTWLPLVRGQLDVAKAIPNHAFGLNQFVIGQPLWEKYLSGEESDPMVALQAAKDAVAAEVKKAQA